MIAAIYARKSTEQNGADADAKSVARQIESAHIFSKAKGWTIADDHIYTDDAVSGAETKKLKNRQRLLDLIASGRAPFQVLILRDTSRFSRRDGDEAFGELKAIAQAGIEVWFYQDGQRFAYGTLGDNIVHFVKAEAAADYRRQIARWTYEAMERKARAGHVTGGRVFGYDNARVNGHVERRVNEGEAAVIRRAYELYSAGHGLTTIAKLLNAEGATAPRAQQGRPKGWAPSSLREVLRRPVYRGEIVWGRAKKRDLSGQVSPTLREPDHWLRLAAPALRIIPESVAKAVDARREAMHHRALRLSNGRLLGRPPGEGARYLLTGILTCATCGGGMEVLSRPSGGRRLFIYRCATNRRKGAHICANSLPVGMRDADDAVLGTIEDTLLNPAVVERALEYAEAAIALDRSADQRAALEEDLADIEAAIRRLTAAIAAGGELAPLVAALKTYDDRRRDVERRLAVMQAPRPTYDAVAVRRQLQSYLVDWRGLLRANVQQGQQVLRRLVKGRLTFIPRDDHYEFTGTGTVRPVIGGLVQNLASPTGFEPVFWP